MNSSATFLERIKWLCYFTCILAILLAFSLLGLAIYIKRMNQEGQTIILWMEVMNISAFFCRS